VIHLIHRDDARLLHLENLVAGITRKRDGFPADDDGDSVSIFQSFCIRKLLERIFLRDEEDKEKQHERRTRKEEEDGISFCCYLDFWYSLFLVTLVFREKETT
jgi:hypothetical protein